MKKAIIALTLILALTSCNQSQTELSYSEVNQTTNQEEFIHQVVESNEDLRQQKTSLQNKVNDLQSKLKGQNQTIRELERTIQNLRQRLQVPPAPQDRIKQGDISIFGNRFTVREGDVFVAVFENTDSMKPVLDQTSLAIQVPPSNYEVETGDIIAFKANYTDKLVVHRIIATGTDSQGWFAITKGDNNPTPDQGKVRKEDIVGVTLSILY